MSHMAGPRTHVFRFFLLYCIIFSHNSIAHTEIRSQHLSLKGTTIWTYQRPAIRPSVILLPFCPAVGHCGDNHIILGDGKHPSSPSSPKKRHLILHLVLMVVFIASANPCPLRFLFKRKITTSSKKPHSVIN